MSRARRWARTDLLVAMAVGLLLFQLVRSWLVERYRVTSRSMEPLLHGDPETGDIVLVDRTAWLGERPRPWDLVVLRNRDDPMQNHLVKRCVALGPRWVDFDGGDVFVGVDRHRLERVTKHPVAHRALRLIHAAFEVGRAGGEGAAFVRADPERWTTTAGAIALRPVATAAELRDATTTAAQDARHQRNPLDASLPGHLGLTAEVDSSFYGATGVRLPGGGSTPRDIGLELLLELDAGAERLQLVFEYAAAYFALELDVRSGEAVFRFHGTERARFEGPPIAAGATTHLEFGRLDGSLFLVLDGGLVWREPVELPRESRLVIRSGGRPRNGLHVGVAGAGGVRIERLVVFRDAHYDAENREPYHIEAGQLFVLGDNASESADSRDRFADPFELDDLIGRPCAILGPRGRTRALPRYPEPPERIDR